MSRGGLGGRGAADSPLLAGKRVKAVRAVKEHTSLICISGEYNSSCCISPAKTMCGCVTEESMTLGWYGGVVGGIVGGIVGGMEGFKDVTISKGESRFRAR